MALLTAFITAVFFFFSISLTFFNSRCIKMFPFPLSITLMHMFLKFFYVWSLRSFMTWYTGKKRIELSCSRYINMVALAGAVSALDIGFSNWSFEFITVSLYTMTKSTSIVFILIFSIIFRLEKRVWSLLLVVALISVGLFMFTFESRQFNIIGFVLVLIASFLSGIRWTSAQILSQKEEWGLSQPIDLIYHTQPWMALVLLPLSFYIESIEVATSDLLFRADDYFQLARNLGYLGVGSILAFGLEFSEYMVISNASSLTLSVAAVFKEICTIYLASKFNGDRISLLNMFGFVVCLSGIALHVYLRTTHDNDSEKLLKKRLV